MNDIAKVEMQNIIWLGRLTKFDHSYCQIEPLAELVESKWIKVDTQKTRFPTRGKVRVNKSDLGKNRSIGSLWVFGCVPSGVDIDRWRAMAPVRAQPVVDLSGISLADARRRLLDSGISLPDHQARNVVVLLEGDTYCTLTFEPRGNLWTARTPEKVIELRHTNFSCVDSFRVNDSLFLPMKDEPEGAVVRRLDWSTDSEFLVKVVARYRAALNGYFSLTNTGNEALVRKLERALIDGKFGPADADDIEALVERMRAEWPKTCRGLQAVGTMSELLLKSDPGKRLLDDAVDQRKRELEAEIENKLRIEIEERLAPLRGEFDGVCKTVEAKVRELTEIQSVLDNLQQERYSLVAEHRKTEAELTIAQKTLQMVVGKLAESETKNAIAVAELETATLRKSDLLASVTDLQTALSDFAKQARREMEATGAHDASALAAFSNRLEGLFHKAGHPVAPLLPAASPPWWSKPAAALPRVTAAELPMRLAAEAEAHGILTQDLVWLDCFVRAGEIVLLLGDHAEFALSAYARIVTGGAVRSHALDPSAIGLDDLWRVPNTGRPTAFALAWHQAKVSPDETVLLCLRDFDAAPFRLWLASFQAILQSPDRPRNFLVVASVVAAFGDEEEFLGAERLRHYLVPLKLGQRPHSGQAAIALDEPLPDVTRFVPSDGIRQELSGPTFLAISKRGNDARVVRRAVRFCQVASEIDSAQGKSLGLAWAGYLLDGRTDGLPLAISAGHDQLKTLHFQR